MRTIGVIGLGRMGGNMSRRLLADGFDVVGYDISEDAVTSLEQAGITSAASPRAVAEAADIVLTSLPTPEIVESAYCASDGVFAGADEDVFSLETSSIDPDTTRRIAEQADAENTQFVDSPVSGGPEAAYEGTLTAIIGADESVIAGTSVDDVLESISTRQYFVGQLGGGHTVKLVNNMMSMGNIVLAMEAMTFAAKRGLDGGEVFEIISSAGGSSNQFRKRVPRVLNRNFEPGFTVNFSRKDLGLALKTADAMDHPMFATNMIHQLYTEAVAAGYGEDDCSSVVKLFEEHADVRVESGSEMDESFEGY